MCGIFGHTLVTQSYSKEHSRDSLDTLRHRGPDSAGEWTDERVYIGHRRLSILDLSERGRQPMVSPDGSVVVAVNGEVYNYRELRDELGRNRFRSNSDSEVLVHGYQDWGIEGLCARIDGMYAFVIYDAREHMLYLVRDRVGIKPLYYGWCDGVFAWASELKAIQRHFNGKLELDVTALYDFFTYLYVPSPKSLYKNIQKLEPAELLQLDLKNKTTRRSRYWHPPEPGSLRLTRAEAQQELQHRLARAVQAQLVSDVPVGFFLSAGVDSASVVAAAVDAGATPRTFCIGFDDDKRSEMAGASATAKFLGAWHRNECLNADGARELHATVRRLYDEPFASGSALPTYLVSRAARRECTVALTGDGGDEIFGGYLRYNLYERVLLARRFVPTRFSGYLKALTSRIPRELDPRLRSLARRLESAFVHEPLAVHTRLIGGLVHEEKAAYRERWSIPEDYDDYWSFRRYYRKDLPAVTQQQFLDFHTYLPDDILTKVDRASMAVALEVRVPLLDIQLVELMFALPESIRLCGRELKGLFKAALSERLPRAVLRRGKTGFSVPMATWGKAYFGEQSSIQDRTLELLGLS
ncbi:MAG TPA: asparagine synthase (glutamine-hydrolyzing) [Polyangiaceae bacterium]|nr:asparagine synthase (glutamine-hydrolyzing) [Polyangiaceae bacterium]